MAWQTQSEIWGSDQSISVCSSASATTSSTLGTASDVGRGVYVADLTVTSISTGTGFDVINLIFQANTSAATSTYVEIANVCMGDATGRGAALTSLSNAQVLMANDGDNDIRLYAYLLGSASAISGVTCYLRPLSSSIGA